MSFFSRMTSKVFGKAESKSIGYPIAPVSGNGLLELVFGINSRVTPYQAMQFYRQASSVATAVDTIAQEIENIKPVIEDKETGQIISKSPVLDLLSNPNSTDPYHRFIGDMARHYLLTHDAFVYAAGSVNRPPIEIWATKPQVINVNCAEDDYPTSYNISQGVGKGDYRRKRMRGKWRYYDGSLKEVFRIRGFTSRIDHAYSDSPLEAAALEARQQILGRHHNLKLLENGGRLSLVAVFGDTLTQEQHDERRLHLNEQFAGSANAGKIGVISSQDLELKEFGTTNKDMDYSNLDQMAREAIFLRYKIPLPLVSQDASTFNNMEQAVYHLYDMAVLPTFKVLASGLTSFLFPRFDIDTSRYRLTYNPEDISALQTRRLDELKKRVDMGLETDNELRAFLPNRTPIEGGDVIYKPATMVPVGSDPLQGDEGFTEEELRRQVERQDV